MSWPCLSRVLSQASHRGNEKLVFLYSQAGQYQAAPTRKQVKGRNEGSLVATTKVKENFVTHHVLQVGVCGNH